MGRRTSPVGLLVALALGAASSGAEADCTIESRLVRDRTYPVIQCDEDAATIDAAIDRATETCVGLPAAFVTKCYDAVVESYVLRDESRLRRLIKEGATVEAAARIMGYTEEEVQKWIAANTGTSQGYSEPDTAPADIVQGWADMAAVMSELGLSP